MHTIESIITADNFRARVRELRDEALRIAGDVMMAEQCNAALRGEQNATWHVAEVLRDAEDQS